MARLSIQVVQRILTEGEVEVVVVFEHAHAICVVKLNAVDVEEPELFDGACDQILQRGVALLETLENFLLDFERGVREELHLYSKEQLRASVSAHADLFE